ncbi:MAG: hypothetical protein WBE32_08355, partial [Pseudolabrys sp.]
ILEDAHWTDPTSLEAFGRTVDRIKTLPALLIVTFRRTGGRLSGFRTSQVCLRGPLAIQRQPERAINRWLG